MVCVYISFSIFLFFLFMKVFFEKMQMLFVGVGVSSQNCYFASGGDVPGKADPCPGMEYWGRNWEKLTPNAPGN